MIYIRINNYNQTTYYYQQCNFDSASNWRCRKKIIFDGMNFLVVLA